MRNKFGTFWMLLPAIVLILVDIYVFQAIKSIYSDSKTSTQRIAYIIYWSLSSITYLALILILIKGNSNWHGWSKILIVGTAQTIFFAKVLILPFVLIDDIIRLFRWIFSFFQTTEDVLQPAGISRLQFLSKLGLALGSMMSIGLVYGIFRGAYNYQVRKVNLKIANLPEVWKGLKIVQFSDMHLGSFADAKPVQTIVDLINEQEADIVFFTGDLVNYASEEVEPYIPILQQIKAKTKVYSILGNHDYGLYKAWNSDEAMHQNLNRLKEIQRNELGWDLLLDEHRIIERNGSTLALIGVQYIGHSMRFGKFGDLKKAYSGAENADVQLLLSHDPSHWDHEVSVVENYRGIHATFAGHTHGFQFGIEIPGIKWSPSKYVYPHWAGLYANVNQKLYVNRGIGFLGYPGRLGISPEVTVFQLT